MAPPAPDQAGSGSVSTNRAPPPSGTSCSTARLASKKLLWSQCPHQCNTSAPAGPKVIVSAYTPGDVLAISEHGVIEIYWIQFYNVYPCPPLPTPPGQIVGFDPAAPTTAPSSTVSLVPSYAPPPPASSVQTSGPPTAALTTGATPVATDTVGGGVTVTAGTAVVPVRTADAAERSLGVHCPLSSVASSANWAPCLRFAWNMCRQSSVLPSSRPGRANQVEVL